MKKVLIILIIFTSCRAKKEVTTTITEREKISYALPGSNRLVIDQLCDTLRAPIHLDSDNGPVKVKVYIDRDKLVLETKYDTIFKDKIKEVEKVVNKDVVRYRTNWKWIIACLVIGFVVGVLRPWRLL